MSSVVLIAPPDQLEALKSRPELVAAQAFPEAEALRALDVITRQRPAAVVLERTFAAGSRGTALINRIKADPALASCEIRVVGGDGQTSMVGARGPESPAAGQAGVAVAPAPAAPLDQRGTRRAPRFKIVDGVEVSVDGNPATLVDLSIVGAMVLSPTILRPNQRVRVTLPDPARPLRIGAAVAWAAFEMPKGGVRYRAGIEFFDADAAIVQRFIDANKKP